MTQEEEIKIKELFSQEYTTKQISEEMNMPLATVNEYLVNIITPKTKRHITKDSRRPKFRTLQTT